MTSSNQLRITKAKKNNHGLLFFLIQIQFALLMNRVFLKTYKMVRNYTFSTINHQDTIFALSTGISSAISIVRVSGPQSIFCLNMLGKNKNGLINNKEAILQKYRIKPRQMSLKNIYSKQKGILDRCLIVYFDKDQSFNGQEMIEFHLHGSRAIVSAVFHQLQSFKFRPAKRGEFSRRAVQNNKISLHQAEAINDLIQSELQFERQVAIQNLLGKNQDFLKEIRKKILETIAYTQAYIQFQEQQVGQGVPEKIKLSIKEVADQILSVIQSSKHYRNIKQGVKISILGKPNVGKSTLMNLLTKKDVSIVSSKPGTTRDLVQSSLNLQDFQVKLVDTAGIRVSDCEIEQEGIRRSKKSMSESQANLLVIDIFQSKIEQFQFFIHVMLSDEEETILNQKNTIVVINKMDKLSQAQRMKKIMLKRLNGTVHQADLLVSLKNQNSDIILLKKIQQNLKHKFKLFKTQSSQVYFTRIRYISSLQRSHKLLKQCQQQLYPDILSSLLREFMSEVDQIIGKVTTQQVLDKVFSTFCIGK